MSLILTNPKTLKNVAIIYLKGCKKYDKKITKNNFVIFYKNKEIVSLNVFNASKYFDIKKTTILDDKSISVIEKNVEEKIKTYPFFVVCEIIEKENHPKTNKLIITKVNIGNELIQIVTNKINLKEKDKIVVALENAVLPNGKLITKSNIMGVESFGMFVSYKTLQISYKEEIIFSEKNIGSIYTF